MAQTPAPGAAATEPASPKTLGVDGAIDLPLGSSRDVAKVGLSLIPRFELALSPALHLTGRVGYIYYLTKVDGAKLESFPFLAGAKFFAREDLYLAAELGFFLDKVTVEGLFGASESETRGHLGGTLGAGYKIGEFDVRVGAQLRDLKHLGDAFSVTVGAGYDFWHG